MKSNSFKEDNLAIDLTHTDPVEKYLHSNVS